MGTCMVKSTAGVQSDRACKGVQYSKSPQNEMTVQDCSGGEIPIQDGKPCRWSSWVQMWLIQGTVVSGNAFHRKVPNWTASDETASGP